MDVVLMIVFGLIAGAIAKMLMPGRDPGGIVVTILLGIVGSLLGGFLFNMLGIGGPNINTNDFSLNALLVSFIGAVVLLGIVNLVRRGSLR